MSTSKLNNAARRGSERTAQECRGASAANGITPGAPAGPAWERPGLSCTPYEGTNEIHTLVIGEGADGPGRLPLRFHRAGWPDRQRGRAASRSDCSGGEGWTMRPMTDGGVARRRYSTARGVWYVYPLGFLGAERFALR